MSSLRVIKAEALGHFSVDAKNKRHAIYSIDFQPGGPRLATGGHDSAVKLWNVEAFLNPGQGGAGTGDSLLATLSNHTKSVNIVRWSKDGKFLASGSDDCCILIYRHTPDGLGSAAFGSQTGSSKNKESWSRCAMLQGHTMDVLDLDWSPRGVLASASIDNRVLVWDCKTVGQGTQTIHTPMAALTVHQNYVKGCSFDPMGKYLVTCGSDNVIIVWDCDSWQPVKELDGPMRGTKDTTIFRRMSWAPDGQCFCASNCIKSSKPVSAVMKRGGDWPSVIDLVGHSAPTVCCRFLPYMLTALPGDGNGGNGGSSGSGGGGGERPTCCVVIGDAVGVVSVWLQHVPKAALVLRDVFDSRASNRAATDVSFLRDGKSTVFAVSSMDGSVVLVDLGDALGKHMEAEALDKHFRKLYGRGQGEGLGLEDAQVLPDPHLLSYLSNDDRRAAAYPGMEMSPAKPAEAEAGAVKPTGFHAASSSSSFSSSSSSSSSGPSAIPSGKSILTMQTQSRGKDGRKRIQPVLINSGGGGGGGDAATSSSSSAAVNPFLPSGAGAGDGSRPAYGRDDDDDDDDDDDGDAGARKRTREDVMTLNGGAVAVAGKKVRAAGPAPPSTILQVTVARDELVFRAPVSGDVTVLVRGTQGFTPGTLGALTELVVKRLVRPSTFQASQQAVVGTFTSVALQSTGTLAKNVAPPSSSSSSSSSSTGAKAAALPVPATNLHWRTAMAGEATSAAALRFSSSSSSSSADEGAGLAVVGCVDGSLHVFSLDSGVRALPPVVLGAAVACVDVVEVKDEEQQLQGQEQGQSGVAIVAMTIDGELWVWRKRGVTMICSCRCSVKSIVASMKCRGARANSASTSTCADVMVSVERVSLTDGALPVVFLRARNAEGGDWQAFQYCRDLAAWTRLADLRHVLSRAFRVLPEQAVEAALAAGATGAAAAGARAMDVLQSEAAYRGGLTAGDIFSLASTTHMASTAVAPSTTREWTTLVTLAHTEERLSVAVLAGSPDDVDHWLTQWVAVCTKTGMHHKVRWAANRLLANGAARARDTHSQAQAQAHAQGAAWDFFDTTAAPQRVLRKVLIPAVGSCGTSAAALLGELEDACSLVS